MGKNSGPRCYRVVLVGLLALCLGPATAGLAGWNHRGALGAAPQVVLFEALVASAACDLQTGKKRIRVHCGDHHAMALHQLLDPLPSGASCFLPPDGGIRIPPYGPVAGITIRAPPLHHS